MKCIGDSVGMARQQSLASVERCGSHQAFEHLCSSSALQKLHLVLTCLSFTGRMVEAATKPVRCLVLLLTLPSVLGGVLDELLRDLHVAPEQHEQTFPSGGAASRGFVHVFFYTFADVLHKEARRTESTQLQYLCVCWMLWVAR